MKAEFNSWFTASGLAANDAEPLFLALVLLDSGASARDAQAWAEMVHSALALASTAAAAVLLKSPEWSVRPGGNPGERFALLHAALHRSWSAGTLDAVGARPSIAISLSSALIFSQALITTLPGGCSKSGFCTFYPPPKS